MYYHFHFTKEKTDKEMLNNFAKVTQLAESRNGI